MIPDKPSIKSDLPGVLLATLLLFYAVSVFFANELVGNILSPLICFVSAFFLFSVYVSGLDRRLGWILAGAACLIWGLGDAFWAVDLQVLNRDPEKDVFLAFFYVLANVSLLVVVLGIALHDRRRWASFQFVLDMFALSFILTGFVYYVILRHFFLNLEILDDPTNSASMVSLVLDMLILSLTVSTILSMDRRKITGFLKAAFLGILVFIFADFMFIFFAFNESYIPNRLIDLLYMLAFVLMGFAGRLYTGKPEIEMNIRMLPETIREIVFRTAVLLVVPVMAAFMHPVDLNEVLFFVGILVVHYIIGLFIRRLVLKELELEAKTREKEYLEARIDERTRELRVMNQTLENLLKRDAITGQFNRKYFLEQTEEWIKSALPGEKVYLMILDFDRFKSINDTYGHDVGDQVLRLIGKKLESVANERTFISRLGGDEFGVVCLRSALESITPLLHIITDLCNSPVSVGSFTIHLSVSIGISSWPDDAKTRSDLMRHADIAMYIVKERKAGGISFFDLSLNAGIERCNTIDLALRKSVIPNEFSLCYQPQFSVDGGTLNGMEALIRWNSPELGVVAPDEFIPVAEENGMIIPLSDWIMRTALRQISDWNGRYAGNLVMGINISPMQLDAPDFLFKLESLLDTMKIRPEWVNLEMTERCAMKGESFIVAIFDRLAHLNIAISIDDFGTGYSSLSYLKKFDIDYLKIAKELIDGIATDDTDCQIVRAIIMMAKALDFRTIAEGVEVAEQVRILASLGCDEIQGYYYGRPVRPDEFEKTYLKS